MYPDMNQATSFTPIWRSEINKPDYARTFYTDLGRTALVYLQPEGATRLYVGFDDLMRMGSPFKTRDPWGIKYALSRGWAYLGLMSYNAFWFRDEPFFDRLEALRDEGLFEGYERTLLCGTSMGGWAAAAFADLAPGANVLAFSPQATLDPNFVPWETRFMRGQQQHWDNRYRFAHDGLNRVSNAYIIYDPFDRGDKIHARMIQGANIHQYHAYGCGHRVALVALRCGGLKGLTDHAMEGDLTLGVYKELMRNRGATVLYRQNMVRRLRSKGHGACAKKFGRACFKMKQDYDAYLASEEAE